MQHDHERVQHVGHLKKFHFFVLQLQNALNFQNEVLRLQHPVLVIHPQENKVILINHFGIIQFLDYAIKRKNKLC